MLLKSHYNHNSLMTLLPFIQAIALYESDSTIQPLKDAQQQSIFKMRAF
jgi:hypothetical protein